MINNNERIKEYSYLVGLEVLNKKTKKVEIIEFIGKYEFIFKSGKKGTYEGLNKYYETNI